jgi:hypothetical protein
MALPNAAAGAMRPSPAEVVEFSFKMHFVPFLY